MKHTRILISAAAVATIATIIGCATAPRETTATAALENPTNEIVHRGYSIRVPAGWAYLPGRSTGLPFAFESDDGVSGALEALIPQDTVDPQTMVDYFLQRIGEDTAQTRQTVLESDAVGSVFVVTADTTEGEHRTYFVANDDRHYAVHVEIATPGLYEIAVFLPVVESVRRTEPGVSARTPAGGGLALLSPDGAWRWLTDHAGGYVVAGEGENGSTRIASIWPATDEQVRRFVERDDTTYVTDAVVPYSPNEARVYASRIRTGTQLFAFFTRDGSQYCVSVQLDEPVGLITPATVRDELAHGASAAFVLAAVVFPGEDRP